MREDLDLNCGVIDAEAIRSALGKFCTLGLMFRAGPGATAADAIDEQVRWDCGASVPHHQ